MTEKYIHLKSGRHYSVEFKHIINATNENDGQRMVLYTGRRKDGSHGTFVREYKEFMNKFKKIRQKDYNINAGDYENKE